MVNDDLCHVAMFTVRRANPRSHRRRSNLDNARFAEMINRLWQLAKANGIPQAALYLFAVALITYLFFT